MFNWIKKIFLNSMSDSKNSNINTTDYVNILSEKEVVQLKTLNKLERFSNIYKNLKDKDERFRKKDALWFIYNECRLEYEFKKDLSMLSVVFERQSEILVNDKKYKQALDTYTTSLYCLLYNYDIFMNDFNLFDRHLNNRRIERIKMLMKNSKISKKEYKEEFDVCIQENIPSFYNQSKVKVICNNILKKL